MTISGVPFMPGIELSRILFEEAVRPLLAEAFPKLRHTAARVGSGSEVLGFDTPRSADHERGPRLEIFLTAEEHGRHAADLRRFLATRLPTQVRGWPTHFQESDDPLDPVGRMLLTDEPVNHRVDVYDLDVWLAERLGVRAAGADLSVRDWLAVPQQRLAETTGGAVFHDGLGTLTVCRRRLEWYPEQVWRYLLACQWQRVSREEAFVGRCAEVGDAHRVGRRRRPPGAGPDASVSAAGATLRPVQQVARQRLQPAAGGRDARSGTALRWRRRTTRRGRRTCVTPTRPSPRCRTRRDSPRRWTRSAGATTRALSWSCTPSASRRHSRAPSRTLSFARCRWWEVWTSGRTVPTCSVCPAPFGP